MIKIHHTGFVVTDLDATISTYKKFGFAVASQFEGELFSRGAMLVKGNILLEFLEYKGADFEAIKIYKNHLAFETDDFDNDLKLLEENGFTRVTEVSTGEIILKKVFLVDNNNNYFELCLISEPTGS